MIAWGIMFGHIGVSALDEMTKKWLWMGNDVVIVWGGVLSITRGYIISPLSLLANEGIIITFRDMMYHNPDSR